MDRTFTGFPLASTLPAEVLDQPLKIGRGMIKPIMFVPDDSQEVKDAYARGERPDLFDVAVRLAFQFAKRSSMHEEQKRARGDVPGIIQCDEFGRPFGTFTPFDPLTMNIDHDPQATVVQHALTPVSPPADVNQVQEHSPKTEEWYAEQDRMYRQVRAEEQARVDAVIAQLRSTLPEGITAMRVAFDILKAEMKDPSYAWSWHCNIAMPFYDGLPENEPDRHVRANIGAGRVMRHVFDIDTMTQYQVEADRQKNG